jgi:hypothetical protein
VVATATELARFTGQHLIGPLAILACAYLVQIFAGLRDADLPVLHVVLDADEEILRWRIQRLRRSTGLAPSSPGRLQSIALVDDPSRPGLASS